MQTIKILVNKTGLAYLNSELLIGRDLGSEFESSLLAIEFTCSKCSFHLLEKSGISCTVASEGTTLCSLVYIRTGNDSQIPITYHLRSSASIYSHIKFKHDTNNNDIKSYDLKRINIK